MDLTLILFAICQIVNFVLGGMIAVIGICISFLKTGKLPYYWQTALINVALLLTNDFARSHNESQILFLLSGLAAPLILYIFAGRAAKQLTDHMSWPLGFPIGLFGLLGLYGAVRTLFALPWEAGIDLQFMERLTAGILLSGSLIALAVTFHLFRPEE